MTSAELKTRLASLLAAQLGTYTDQTGAVRGPAINVGNTPTGFTAVGLEVIIASNPEITPVNLHHNAALETERRIYLIPHDTITPDGRSNPLLPGMLEAATRRILTAFTSTSIGNIPANETLGILTQTSITIRS